MTFRDVLKEKVDKEVEIVRNGAGIDIFFSFSPHSVVMIKAVEEDFFTVEDKRGIIRMYAIRAIVSINM